MRLFRARLGLVPALLLCGVLLAQAPAQAQEPPTFQLQLKGHRFEPARLTVPAGVRFVLLVRNADDTPAEFESGALNVEKIISAGREALVRLGPLQPGEYAFKDDFHQATGQGVLVAVAP